MKIKKWTKDETKTFDVVNYAINQIKPKALPCSDMAKILSKSSIFSVCAIDSMIKDFKELKHIDLTAEACDSIIDYATRHAIALEDAAISYFKALNLK